MTTVNYKVVQIHHYAAYSASVIGFPLPSNRDWNNDFLEGKRECLFCAVLCAAAVHSAMHTNMNRPNSCLLVRFSFSVLILLDLALGLFCVIVYLCLCVCFCCVRFSFFSTCQEID